MANLEQMERQRAKIIMALSHGTIMVNADVLRKALSEVFYKSSVNEIMKIVASVNGVEGLKMDAVTKETLDLALLTKDGIPLEFTDEALLDGVTEDDIYDDETGLRVIGEMDLSIDKEDESWYSQL